MLVVTDRLKIPLREFRFTFSRSAGPGGQNVNKVNSKATLRWRIVDSESLPGDVLQRFRTRHGTWITREGDVLVTSQVYRDQPRNTQACLDRLRSLLLSVADPPRRRVKTRPTKSSQRRRLASKQHRSKAKESRREPGNSSD